MGYNRKAFTLIELITVMAIIGVLSASGAYLLTYVVQNSIFIPNQLNMNMLVSDALDIMIEGDSSAKGLRFSREITDIQDYQVTFIYQDQLGGNHTVIFQLDPVASRLSRSIDGVSARIPYYVNDVATTVSISGKNNKLFEYYDASGTPTINPADVRWITMTLVSQTGTGSYVNWEGQSEQMTSVAVNKFQ